MCQIIDSFRFTCEKTMVIANTRKDARGCIWIKKDFSGERKSHSVVSNSLRPHGLFSPCSSPGQNTGVGNLSLLQWIFLTQESNQSLLHCRQILYQLSYQGKLCIKHNILFSYTAFWSKIKMRNLLKKSKNATSLISYFLISQLHAGFCLHHTSETDLTKVTNSLVTSATIIHSFVRAILLSFYFPDTLCSWYAPTCSAIRLLCTLCFLCYFH